MPSKSQRYDKSVICSLNVDTMKFSRQGFTLIELLVVIGIIGILSSIVLASLQTSRKKALDAAVIQEMNSVRSAVELYASIHNDKYADGTANPPLNGFSNDVSCDLASPLTPTNGWYGNDPSVAKILSSLKSRTSYISCALNYGYTQWAAVSKLPSGPTSGAGQIWRCVDWKGTSKQYTQPTPPMTSTGISRITTVNCL